MEYRRNNRHYVMTEKPDEAVLAEYLKKENEGRKRMELIAEAAYVLIFSLAIFFLTGKRPAAFLLSALFLTLYWTWRASKHKEQYESPYEAVEARPWFITATDKFWYVTDLNFEYLDTDNLTSFVWSEENTHAEGLGLCAINKSDLNELGELIVAFKEELEKAEFSPSLKKLLAQSEQAFRELKKKGTRRHDFLIGRLIGCAELISDMKSYTDDFPNLSLESMEGKASGEASLPGYDEKDEKQLYELICSMRDIIDRIYSRPFRREQAE